MSDCRFGVSPVNYPDPDPDAHQSIMNMVIVFIITVGDHLITRSLYKVIYFTTNNEPSRQCRIVLIELYSVFTCKNTGAQFLYVILVM